MQDFTYAVIGDPVLHSLSPVIYNTLFSIYDIPHKYGAVTVKKEELSGFFKNCGGLLGLNVTMPHKKSVIPFLDEIDQDAKITGSVNTIRLSLGKSEGFSTDAQGFLDSAKSDGYTFLNKRVLILGAGSVARIIALKLAQEGARSVIFANRSVCMAKIAAEFISDKGWTSSAAVSFDLKTLISIASNSDALINATPLGMDGCPQFESLDFVDALTKDAPVFDLIYKPAETALIKRARLNGNFSKNGLDMLIYQAFHAFNIFCGIMPDESALKKLRLAL